MRLIDADALCKTVCDLRCGCAPNECGYEDDYGKYCEIAQFIEHAPTIEAVPLKPLAEWLAEYCTPICPPPPDAMLAIIDPARPITFTDITNAWEKALQTKIWEDDND